MAGHSTLLQRASLTHVAANQDNERVSRLAITTNNKGNAYGSWGVRFYRRWHLYEAFPHGPGTGVVRYQGNLATTAPNK